MYVVATVELPPKTEVVNAPVELFSVTPAPASTEVVSENAIVLSDEPAIVATVPEKSPAIEPNEPADVLNVGAADAVMIAFVLLAALPLSNSTLT